MCPAGRSNLEVRYSSSAILRAVERSQLLLKALGVVQIDLELQHFANLLNVGAVDGQIQRCPQKRVLDFERLLLERDQTLLAGFLGKSLS